MGGAAGRPERLRHLLRRALLLARRRRGVHVPRWRAGAALHHRHRSRRGRLWLLHAVRGAFKVKDDIPPWFIWVYHIGFPSYSYRVFMYNEFKPIEAFDEGAPF